MTVTARFGGCQHGFTLGALYSLLVKQPVFANLPTIKKSKCAKPVNRRSYSYVFNVISG